MSKRGPTPPQISAALATAALTGVALGLRRRRRPASAAADGGTDAATAGGTDGGPASQQWTCQCGQAFRVHGEGRHRVYWLHDAELGDPLLDERCPSCGQALPAGTRRAP